MPKSEILPSKSKRKAIPLRMDDETESALTFIREKQAPQNASEKDLPSYNTVICACIRAIAYKIKNDGTQKII